MVKAAVESLSAFLQSILGYFPPSLPLLMTAAFLGNQLSTFRAEFVGTILMVGLTFSAGKWIGKDDFRVAWGSHLLGVIAADFLGGGQQVNPAVSISMLCLGKIDYTSAYVRIAAQMAGGLVAFPLFHAISEAMKWQHFGGPEFKITDNDAHGTASFLSEFCVTFLLMWVIYVLNWELNFGSLHYIIKQSLTAVAIRVLIEAFPTAGPAMNPMLATTWYVFGVSKTFEYPSHFAHYFVYWVGPFLAAIVASITYVLYAGGTLFGVQWPLPTLKGKKPVKGKKD